ncbi:hypothetical protein BDA96_02G278100 [Sorghum bicolor]|uniref:Uncharacterized protein n=1 Tax=Sorghum bicolor TaxID=4558 RepID=A0A921RST6_SORBI|nr:hypothetical protein BDA96_02G278100 [Sorghum bicolor]
MAPPISASQSTITILKIFPKPPAPDTSSNNFTVGAKFDNRRALLCGLVAAAAGTVLSPDIAGAASKRRSPPPGPAEEKKDPNVSGVQAKVLASRKRKEAMKEAVAKLRERGKPVDK